MAPSPHLAQGTAPDPSAVLHPKTQRMVHVQTGMAATASSPLHCAPRKAPTPSTTPRPDKMRMRTHVTATAPNPLHLAPRTALDPSAALHPKTWRRTTMGKTATAPSPLHLVLRTASLPHPTPRTALHPNKTSMKTGATTKAPKQASACRASTGPTLQALFSRRRSPGMSGGCAG
jgi:hypothetical protein